MRVLQKTKKKEQEKRKQQSKIHSRKQKNLSTSNT